MSSAAVKEQEYDFAMPKRRQRSVHSAMSSLSKRLPHLSLKSATAKVNRPRPKVNKPSGEGPRK